MKPNWEMTEADVEACLKATTWYPADRDYFRGGGFSSNFLSKGGMPVTMMRLNLVKGLGPVLQLAEGWTVDIDPEIHQVLNMRTDPTWPTTWFVPRLCDKPAFRDVYSVMNNWGANHGAISYGHIGQDLITLASIIYDKIFGIDHRSFSVSDNRGATTLYPCRPPGDRQSVFELHRRILLSDGESAFPVPPSEPYCFH